MCWQTGNTTGYRFRGTRRWGGSRHLRVCLPITPAAEIVINPASGAMYCCLFQLSKHLGVVYKSIDGGATWTAFGDGLPNTGIQKLAISADGYLYAYNGGGGMYRTVLSVQ